MSDNPHQSFFDDAAMAWNEPELIETTRGLWPTAGLQRTTGLHEDDTAWSAWVEYRLDGELVHRSARTHLKQPAVAHGVAAAFA